MVSKQKVREALNAYYDVRGWDKERGAPHRENLEELGLTELARDVVLQWKQDSKL
jgi:aldehyde:ferredoxin oxidoreductase